MNIDVFRVLAPGLGATLQDQGRLGWRRFGVPPSGAMDDHAAAWANRLLDNLPKAPVLELLLQGVRLEVLQDSWIAITGADADINVPTWKTVRVKTGQVVECPHNRAGVWSYIGVEGGFQAWQLLGSASVYARGKIGKPCSAGEILSRSAASSFHLNAGVAGRVVVWSERRRYDSPPTLRVWPGPQRNFLSEPGQRAFFSQEWTLSSQSDRVGYRLTGAELEPRQEQIISEPICVGTIQLPPDGQPIVTMRDGPTVGGYPKIGLVDPIDLSWLTQCRPGQKVRFQAVQ